MNVFAYNRQSAVDYAHRWAYGRNPQYYNYDKIGGDCTNFASQVLYAGCGVMNYTPTFGWYYKNANNKAPAWTDVDYLYAFLVKNKAAGPFGVRVGIEQAQPGDIVQLSFSEAGFQHSPVIVAVGQVPSYENILVAAHTIDSDNRPLSTYQWQDIRFIHILGCRK